MQPHKACCICTTSYNLLLAGCCTPSCVAADSLSSDLESACGMGHHVGFSQVPHLSIDADIKRAVIVFISTNSAALIMQRSRGLQSSQVGFSIANTSCIYVKRGVRLGLGITPMKYYLHHTPI